MPELRDQLQATLGDAYTIERELGGGGMSRVFVARENTLGRQIVVKTVPSAAAGSVSVERFNREIQVTAQLQHPHIVPVLSAGDADGVPFYTMPFVKGETLRARLSKSGELSVNETMHILRNIASALTYAHGEGIVHRDIKPENVILTGGVAVVTDFGVAKAMSASVTAGGNADGHLTSLGVALGTPAYMAPEQAAAEPHVDHRADIYAFGCVGYEMLAGSAPFAGRPLQQMLVAHVTEAPTPLLERRANVPPALAALVMKCLEKRAGDRPQTAAELTLALDAIGTPSVGIEPTHLKVPPRPRSRGPLILGLLGFPIAVAIGLLAWPRLFAARPITLGAQAPVAGDEGIEAEPAISPDGKLIAYSAVAPDGARIMWRQIDGGTANVLAGDVAGAQFWPTWSPDGLSIAFAVYGVGIYVAPAFGGQARMIADLDFESAQTLERAGTPAWSPDGRQIAFSKAGAIWVGSPEGGEPRRVAGNNAHSPAWSPDGRMIAYVEGIRPSFNNQSVTTIWLVPSAGGDSVAVSDTKNVNVSPVWTADGKSLLYVSNAGGLRDIYQQAIAGGRPKGPPTRLTTGLAPYRISLTHDGAALGYDVVRDYTNIWQVEVPPAGTASTSSATAVTKMNGRIEIMSIAPDGKWLSFDFDGGGGADIYKVQLDGSAPVRVTTDPANDFGPEWSTNGAEIAFHSTRTGPSRDIYLIRADGTGERQLTNGDRREWYAKWLGPDEVAFSSDDGQTAEAMSVKRGSNGSWSAPTPLPVNPIFAADPFTGTPPRVAQVIRGALSVQPLDGSQEARVVTDSARLGGQILENIQWSPDGESIFTWSLVPRADGTGYVPDVLRMWNVPVSGGAPRRVLETEPSFLVPRTEFATDGRRIFFLRADFQSDVWVMKLQP